LTVGWAVGVTVGFTVGLSVGADVTAHEAVAKCSRIPANHTEKRSGLDLSPTTSFCRSSWNKQHRIPG